MDIFHGVHVKFCKLGCISFLMIQKLCDQQRWAMRWPWPWPWFIVMHWFTCWRHPCLSSAAAAVPSSQLSSISLWLFVLYFYKSVVIFLVPCIVLSVSTHLPVRVSAWWLMKSENLQLHQVQVASVPYILGSTILGQSGDVEGPGLPT